MARVLHPGDIVHAELNSNDLPATRKFLTDVFGWKFERMPGEMEYWTFRPKGAPPGGGLMKPQGGMPPGTVNYVLVTSLDKAIAKIVAKGGKILVPKQEIPGIGSFAVFEAPGGLVTGIWRATSKR
ncbi:MAG TPA: VOC family protein [Thermoplasmata archaeon]|nr:VOC family protein [Thermoplasmata archaeon]